MDIFLNLCRLFLYLCLLHSLGINAYDGFCDEVHVSMFCSCDAKYKHTTMSCFITNDVKKNDDIWGEMSTVENVVILKLNSRFPAQLRELPLESLQSMPFLEILIVQQANLSELQPHAISGLKYLRELELEGCEITELQSQAIADLPQLKTLSLKDNRLQEVLAESLTGLLELEKLYLEQNSISRIESCAFCDLQNLKLLHLFQNEITDLTDYMFRGLRYLKRLDISQNKIRILNDRIFHSMPKLEDLDLSNNLIHHVGHRTFEGLKMLQTLSLRANKLKILPKLIFRFLPHLRIVDLDKNELVTFQKEILEHMNNSKDPHFYVSIKNNSFICNCELSWVKTYIQFNYSHQFTKELEQLECSAKGKNVTIRLLDMDCNKTIFHQKNATTPRSSVEHSFKLIPYEIQKLKNKTMASRVVKTDDAIINQDSNIVEQTEMISGASPSGSRTIGADFYLTLFVVVPTLLFVTKR